MADTVEQIWRRVLLHCPLASPMLARLWVQNSYNRLCEDKRWSHLRGESEFLTSAQKTGTVSVTRSSATVTGVGITFAATDVDRQFRISTGPPYSIDSVNVGANTAILDRVYGGTTGVTESATIMDAYMTVPEDFASFLAVLDPVNSWKLRHWITDDELNRWDPSRNSTGTPWCVATRRLASTTSLNGRIQYELWPYQTAAARYPFYYIKRPATLSDTDYLQGTFRHRTDIVLQGALIEAAKWPGNSRTEPNPYFNLNLAMMLKKEQIADLEQIARTDEETYMTWLETTGISTYEYAPMDARYLQNHDVGAVPLMYHAPAIHW